MKKDMDRDLSEQLTDLISECKTLLETINDNNFVPHIITQPTDQEVEVAEGATATFTVVANNIVSYQWQYKNSPQSTTWFNSTATGNTTASLTVTVTVEARYNSRYRCQMTGKDGSVITTNVVKVARPNET